MAMPIAIPGKEPGTLFIPALGKTIKQTESREDDFYDSVAKALGAIAAGTSLELFRDLDNKNIQHTNLKTQRRIPAGSEFAMNRVGVHLHQAVGNTPTQVVDSLKVSHAGALIFKINSREITTGPLYKYQSGLGMTGFSVTAAAEANTTTTGVPSAAAAPQLLVVQPVADDDDLNGEIIFKDNAWLPGGSAMPTTTAVTGYTVFLHGVIKSPLGK